MRKTNENPSFHLVCLLTHFSSIFCLFCVYFVSVYILLTMLTVLTGSNMWAQTFSYTENNKILTIGVMKICLMTMMQLVRCKLRLQSANLRLLL